MNNSLSKLGYSFLLFLVALFATGTHIYAQSAVYVAAKKKFKENIGTNITAVYEKKLNALDTQKADYEKLVYKLQIEWQQLQSQLDTMTPRRKAASIHS